MVQKVQKPPFTCKQAPNPLNYLTFWQGGFCTIGLQKPAETCKNPLGIFKHVHKKACSRVCTGKIKLDTGGYKLDMIIQYSEHSALVSFLCFPCVPWFVSHDKKNDQPRNARNTRKK